MKPVEPSEEDKTHAIGFARYAYDYIEAARTVDETIGAQEGHEIVSPVPAYFLAMHGIELTLKAFLRYHGTSVRSLRSPREYGHDLHACFRRAKELGLLEIFAMRDGDAKAFELLSKLNADQGLRYVRTGLNEFPSWAIVAPLAVRLHQAIAPLVGYEKTFRVHFG
ncbi:hypothetical protein [Paraburkholderia strydomiana]|uniref:hypothetical protein n=1 Tax=Paraburkholderia strydomiana TaxID=1245417 RepID=UPI001BE4E875|nr:hypothetical protein [Paraburkholderia strydomiana]MBT2791942.1 hypothetical protein [Paraburkholderia strydomiana]